MKSLKYANGITTTYTDDSLGRVKTIKNFVYDLTYGYDSKGNVTSITGNNGVVVASSYTYYDNDWLKGASQGQKVYAYTYDAAGNRTKKTINSVQTTYEYDSQSLNLLDKINGQSLTHDSRGNMIGRNDIGTGYTYNQSNQLTMVLKNGQDVGRYYYNSEGKRYKKVENGQSTYYVYSGEMLLYERQPDGTVVYYIYLNGKQVAKVERKNGVDKKYFYHTDHLGSTRAITDIAKTVVGRFEYQPFGLEETAVTGDDTLTFTGKMQDNPTGLMYFNARYYDPTLGRFITEDPAKDGTNWYVYCANCPLKYVDPTGKRGVLAQNDLYDCRFDEPEGYVPQTGIRFEKIAGGVLKTDADCKWISDQTITFRALEYTSPNGDYYADRSYLFIGSSGSATSRPRVETWSETIRPDNVTPEIKEMFN